VPQLRTIERADHQDLVRLLRGPAVGGDEHAVCLWTALKRAWLETMDNKSTHAATLLSNNLGKNVEENVSGFLFDILSILKI